ncbi:MAG: methionine adenosyltransferase [Candidatus Nanosalina sp. J07AB43]|nr:MAG: methionine adenosyltransferase [Candidatus Nanosalina sp. J07AB43]
MEFLDYTSVKCDPVGKRNTELVERKGLGHPDSICDGIAESVSRSLSEEYKKRFGRVLHHNTDEVQLVAGDSKPKYGGGEVVTPIYVLLAGRATKEFEGEKIPVDEIALEAARDYIRDNFEELKLRQVEFDCRIGETSTDLKSIFSNESPVSNDTSFGVGHSPLSNTEKVVRSVEELIRNQVHEAGEDVKVMGLRRGSKLKLTVAAAMISERVAGIEEYLEAKKKIKKVAENYIRDNTSLEPKIFVNTADDMEVGDVYLTETGTSAEMGDDGSVGRGNRVNGLITPHRSMSLEAASGKNPVNHVGKIYNVLANRISESLSGHGFTEVKMLSQIGVPMDEPQSVEVRSEASKEEVKEAIRKELDSPSITEEAIEGDLPTF